MTLPRRTLASDIQKLVDDLAAEGARREAAVARLTIIGAAAGPRVAAVASDEAAPVDQRVAALDVLDQLGGVRAATTALALTETGDSRLATAAIGALGRVVRGADRHAARALDRLSGLALDAGAPLDRRLAALAALEGLPDRQLRPIHEALARDPASRVVARVIRQQAGVMAPLDELVEEGLPDDPELVGAIVREDAGSTRVTVLRRAIDAVRDREREAAGAGGRDAAERQAAWLAVRGQLHQELSARESRLALYDLREAFESATAPLPMGFLAAAGRVGDATCLESLARAWMTAPDDRWWRDHLAAVFQTVVRRERLTRRHPALIRILTRWPAAGVLVASAPKTGPGRRRAPA